MAAYIDHRRDSTAQITAENIWQMAFDPTTSSLYDRNLPHIDDVRSREHIARLKK